MFNRRHHCRKCGILVCGEHSKNKEVLPNVHKTQKQRICDNCFNNRGNAAVTPKSRSASEAPAATATAEVSSPSKPRTASLCSPPAPTSPAPKSPTSATARTSTAAAPSTFSSSVEDRIRKNTAGGTPAEPLARTALSVQKPPSSAPPPVPARSPTAASPAAPTSAPPKVPRSASPLPGKLATAGGASWVKKDDPADGATTGQRKKRIHLDLSLFCCHPRFFLFAHLRFFCRRLHFPPLALLISQRPNVPCAAEPVLPHRHLPTGRPAAQQPLRPLYSQSRNPVPHRLCRPPRPLSSAAARAILSVSSHSRCSCSSRTHICPAKGAAGSAAPRAQEPSPHSPDPSSPHSPDPSSPHPHPRHRHCIPSTPAGAGEAAVHVARSPCSSATSTQQAPAVPPAMPPPIPTSLPPPKPSPASAPQAPPAPPAAAPVAAVAAPPAAAPPLAGSPPPQPPRGSTPPPPPPPPKAPTTKGASPPPPPPPPPPPATATAPAPAPAAAATEEADDEHFRKFRKMKEMLPEGAVRQKMLAEGYAPTDIDSFPGGEGIHAAPAQQFWSWSCCYPCQSPRRAG